MQLLQDTFIIEQLQIINEGKADGPMKICGIFGRCNEKNNNGRIYPTAVLESQLEKVKPLITERRLCGELDHPQNDTVKLANASHLVTKLEMKGNDLIGEAEILKTPAGLTAKALIEGGVKIGISSRGMGTLSEDHNGDKIVNEDFRLVTFDLVADPSTRGAYPALAESTQSQFVRESQSKLKKESNFVTMLQSKMRDAYQPWIDEAKKPKKPKKPETLKDKVAKLNQDREKYPLIRPQAKAVSDAFELVKADGIWHRIAEALLGEDFAAQVKKSKQQEQADSMKASLRRIRRATRPVKTKALRARKEDKVKKKEAKSEKEKPKLPTDDAAAGLMGLSIRKTKKQDIDAGTSYRQIGNLLMEALADLEKESAAEETAKAAKRQARALNRSQGGGDAGSKGEGFVGRYVRHKQAQGHQRSLDKDARAHAEQLPASQARGEAAASKTKAKADAKVSKIQAKSGVTTDRITALGDVKTQGKADIAKIKTQGKADRTGAKQATKTGDVQHKQTNIQALRAKERAAAPEGSVASQGLTLRSGAGVVRGAHGKVRDLAVKSAEKLPELGRKAGQLTGRAGRAVRSFIKKRRGTAKDTTTPETAKDTTTPETAKDTTTPKTPPASDIPQDKPQPGKDGKTPAEHKAKREFGGALDKGPISSKNLAAKLKGAVENSADKETNRKTRAADAQTRKFMGGSVGSFSSPISDKMFPGKKAHDLPTGPKRFAPTKRSTKNIAQRATDVAALRDLRTKGNTAGARSSQIQRQKSRQAHWSSPEAQGLPRKKKKALNLATQQRAGTEYAQIGSILAEMLGLNEISRTYKSMGPQELATADTDWKRKQSFLPGHKKFKRAHRNPTAERERQRKVKVDLEQSGKEF